MVLFLLCSAIGPVLHLGLVPICKLISLFMSLQGQTLHSVIVVAYSGFRTAVYCRYFFHVLKGRHLTSYANLILAYKHQSLLRIDARILINISQFSEVLAIFTVITVVFLSSSFFFQIGPDI